MNCYDCRHHGTIPGDAHISCNHPKNKSSDFFGDPLNEVLAIFASVGRADPLVSPTAANMGITINAHGLGHGWANWPWNFDPIWIDTCNCFEEKS